ncbi:hypothetical protein ACHAXS_006629, partial [Conticribra weissflogii]
MSVLIWGDQEGQTFYHLSETDGAKGPTGSSTSLFWGEKIAALTSFTVGRRGRPGVRARVIGGSSL